MQISPSREWLNVLVLAEQSSRYELIANALNLSLTRNESLI